MNNESLFDKDTSSGSDSGVACEPIIPAEYKSALSDLSFDEGGSASSPADIPSKETGDYSSPLNSSLNRPRPRLSRAWVRVSNLFRSARSAEKWKKLFIAAISANWFKRVAAILLLTIVSLTFVETWLISSVNSGRPDAAASRSPSVLGATSSAPANVHADSDVKGKMVQSANLEQLESKQAKVSGKKVKRFQIVAYNRKSEKERFVSRFKRGEFYKANMDKVKLSVARNRRGVFFVKATVPAELEPQLKDYLAKRFGINQILELSRR